MRMLQEVYYHQPIATIAVSRSPIRCGSLRIYKTNGRLRKGSVTPDGRLGGLTPHHLPMSIKTRQHRVRDIRLSLGRGSVQGLPCVENIPDELLDIALVDERREDEALQANHRLPVVGFPVAVGHGDADAFAAHRPLV